MAADQFVKVMEEGGRLVEDDEGFLIESGILSDEF